MGSKSCVDLVSKAGFTLVEVMVATLVLSIGIGTLYTMHLTAIRANATAYKLTASSNWASDRIERLLALSYDDPDLIDDNGDGTDQDSDNDGIDDVGTDLNFGLDNVGPQADGRDNTAPAGYTIVWNIAVDTPVPNSKTIRVIVTSPDRGGTQTVRMTYIKAEVI